MHYILTQIYFSTLGLIVKLKWDYFSKTVLPDGKNTPMAKSRYSWIKDLALEIHMMNNQFVYN